MPSVKRGLLFKYFDKFLCGLVALGLLIGIVYALSRASSLPEQIRPQAVNANVDIIRKRLQAAAKPLAATVPSPASLENVASPPAVRGHVMIWDLPRLYPPIKVGLDKDFVLQFTNSDNSAAAPLGEGTVTVQAAQGMAPPVDVIAHPVDGDYSRVKLHSRAYVGPDGVATANVVGYEGRIAHIYPVIVDSSVNKTAYAPSLNVASAQGTVSLEIVPDARIAQEGVVLAYYEIWRRDWSNPLGKYELVDEVKPGGKSLSAAATASGVGRAGLVGAAAGAYRGMAGVPANVPGAASGGAAEGAPITWNDSRVQPGNKYNYKVRAIGNNTFPTEGDYCEPVLAQVLPDIDFRFTLTTADNVRFDLVKAVGAGASKESFWRGVGDAIGEIVTNRTTGVQDNYSTGYILVDIQPAAIQPNKPGPTGRVIYADDEGNLRVLWNGQTKADDLWDRLKAAAAPAPGPRMPFGPGFRPGGRPGGR